MVDGSPLGGRCKAGPRAEGGSTLAQGLSCHSLLLFPADTWTPASGLWHIILDSVRRIEWIHVCGPKAGPPPTVLCQTLLLTLLNPLITNSTSISWLSPLSQELCSVLGTWDEHNIVPVIKTVPLIVGKDRGITSAVTAVRCAECYDGGHA